MVIVEFSKVVITVSDENGSRKYVVGIKLCNREPAIVSNQGKPLVFDTVEEAQSYIDEDD